MTQPRNPPDPAPRDGIDRRAFLHYGAAGGALAAAQAAGRALPFPGVLARPAAGAGAAFELEEVTIAQLQDGMKSGRWTARGLAEAYLARIRELDPRLKAVIETNPDALAIADTLDRERKAGKLRGPLHGVPVLVKDNLDTADRMQTTAGSLALVGSTPARDAFVVQRLRAAGAVLLGKTNLSEWANFRSTHSSSGWSGRGGQCRNPYALDRSPCGSSSGTGAGIAANFAAVGIGTETDGSIVCPSAANSLVGIKPTLGLVSRAGIVPIAHSQDTAGPMTRTVTDAAILLSAIAGVDARDAATAESRGQAASDYTRFLDPNGLRGARIGVAREKLFGYSAETDRLAGEALEAMKRAGAVLVDPANLAHVGEYDDAEFSVLLYEFKADLDAYLAGRPGAPASLEALIDFNERNRDKEMPFFGQEIFLQAQEKGPLTDRAYLDALEKCRRLARAEGIDGLMDEQRLDAIVAPTGNPAWTIDLVNGDHFLGGSSTPAAVAGYPSISVPIGYAFGLPVGLSFIGRAWSEPVLIRLAYALEQATKARRAPTLPETAVL
ncbi:MAG TPA: amidase [Longimicrobiales bacterium]|nr:amidase [Longimicrobiales bacterium]